MEVRLMSHSCVQLARLVGLVRRVELAQLENDKEWGLLIRGRGFDRLLEKELLDVPGLLRPTGWATPRPVTFCSRKAAERYAQHLGLLPLPSRWRITESGWTQRAPR